MQNFISEGEADFEQLLSIPSQNRIPALCEEFGAKRMHQIIRLILKEFCHRFPVTKARKPSETKIHVCVCQLILESGEDYLSLEDLIIFFERWKQGIYGPFEKELTIRIILDKLELYRQARHEAYIELKKKKEALLNRAEESQSPEPTMIRELFDHARLPLPPKKKAG